MRGTLVRVSGNILVLEGEGPRGFELDDHLVSARDYEFSGVSKKADKSSSGKPYQPDIRINGKPSFLEDLKPGDYIQLSGRPVVTIVATRSK